DGGLYSNYGTETYFLGKAHEDGKTIVEIESASEQYEMMGSIPMSIQVQSVTDCIGDEKYQLQVEGMQALYEAWAAFDDEALETLNADTAVLPEGLDEAEYNQFFDLMYLDRQVTMGEAAVDFLESGEDVFMFVGAAHFYIEEDILTYLENAGYTVNAVNGDEAAAA
ncbi:MAG: TraB/GumN family protein, partial [Oscillospiraceae bacterium]|nr:TraB/GumN family protein [Oscillospiraceae bacterium]